MKNNEMAKFVEKYSGNYAFSEAILNPYGGNVNNYCPLVLDILM